VTIYDLTFFAYPEYYPPNHRRFWKTWVPKAIKKANAVIAISHYTRKVIEQFLPTEAHKIKVIYLGVENRFHPNYALGLLEKIRKRYNLPREYLLTVGGIGAAHKNLEGLLEGYGILVNHHKINHHLVVVGDIGKDPLGIVNRTRNGKMAEKIHFLDFIPEEDLPIIYSGASVFITASYAEGFGLPIVEALACGIPVVGSNVTSIPEIMGGCGMLFDSRRPDELAQKVIQMLSNLSLRREFISKGIERSKQFSWDSAARETLSLFDAIY